MHPLVRWQFVGGMAEAERKAFLFTNVTDGLGRNYDIPVVVGAIAANRRSTASACARRSRRSRRSGITPSPTDRAAHGGRTRCATKSCTKETRCAARAAGSTSADSDLDARLRQRADIDRDQCDYARSGNGRAEHGHLPRRAESAGSPGRAHGDARRWSGRLPALSQISKARASRCRVRSCSAVRLTSPSWGRRSSRSTSMN